MNSGDDTLDLPEILLSRWTFESPYVGFPSLSAVQAKPVLVLPVWLRSRQVGAISKAPPFRTEDAWCSNHDFCTSLVAVSCLIDSGLRPDLPQIPRG